GPSARRTHTVRGDDRDLSVEVSSADCQVGDQMAALLVVRDLTERHQAEAARTASEARQRTTLQTIAEGVVLYDLEPSGAARPALANAAALDLLGVSLDQLRDHVDGRPHRAGVCDGDGVPMVEDHYLVQRTARTGVALEGVVWGIRGHHAHEPVTWFRSSTRPVRDDTGAMTGVVLSIVDITADRAAQIELGRTHARFSALVEHGHDLITVMAPDGTISYASPACQAILGREPARLVGEHLLSVVHPDDRGHWAGQVAAVLTRADAVESAECRVSDANGGWRHIEFTLANRVHDPSVEGVVCTGRDVTERVDAAARLAHLANHDNLTNLPNRTLLLDRLHQALAHAKRTGEPCALFFLDLDHFKDVNDTLGHAAGDELLGTVAGRLREVIRADDTVARIGGDEFVILAPNLTLSAAGELAERMRCSLDEPVLLGRNSVSVTASVGMALSDHHQADRLMQEADLALYRAKERGRNRWELYDAGMRAMLHHKVETEQLLRRALDEGRVVVLHQPIVDMGDGRVVATEALARIEEDGRLVSPAEFIGVAEESGLIVPLGTEVL
ncbi:MAG: diguanylate cyclase domain-containing protein, partial [Acidimicrobiales bacterium]